MTEKLVMVVAMTIKSPMSRPTEEEILQAIEATLKRCRRKTDMPLAILREFDRRGLQVRRPTTRMTEEARKGQARIAP